MLSDSRENRDVVAEKLQRLHSVTRDMMAADSRGELYDIATAAATDLLGFEYNTLRTLDEERGVLVPVGVSPALERQTQTRRPYERGETIQWNALDQERLLIYQDITEIDDGADRTGNGSMIIVPLSSFGVLTLGSSEPRSIDPSDEELARILGANIETALERLEHIETLQARKEALEERNDRLDAFAGKASHELRNPLQVIRGRLEMVRDTEDLSKLDQIERSVARMERLVDDILTLSRAEHLELDVDVLPIATVAAESWEAIRRQECTLSVETDARIRADEDRLRQVFENLFRNSVEHAGDDVTITVDRLDDGFVVEDDGRGFSETTPGILSAAEGEFDAAEAGFGLRVIEEIATLHGWSVTAGEGEHGGARFEFRGVDRPREGSEHAPDV